MATKVVMEALSPTMEEGRLVEWKKQPGDTVAVGDVLAEVETDKAVMELVARTAGTLLSQAVAAGVTVPVGNELGQIGEAGEGGKGGTGGSDATNGRERTAPPPAAARSTASAPTAALATAAAPAAAMATALAPTVGTRLKASPLARKIAAARGVDLRDLTGTGPEGRIVLRDLEGAGERGNAGERGTGNRERLAATAAPAARTPVPRSPFPVPQAGTTGYEDIPLTQIRKTIAKRLAQSIGPVPTYYLTMEADMTRAAEARDALNALGEGKVSFNDIVIKATALALRQHPACNAWWQDDRIRYWREVHIAMAVAVEDGLITPVIRHADLKSLRDIGAEAKDLAQRARDRRLKPEEYMGGTFSVSNLGMFDIDEFTAIINPPEAAILAVGRIADQVVAHEGQPAIRKRLRLTLSCDHRVIDGATGAQFLRTLVRMLENPLGMVW
jgi:pyruvate dehydrogenase E2 component (dihydrolipoamide acetyltransferase)